MSPTRPNTARAFTFVEMLAVVFVMSILASAAVALYGSTRRSSAARACKANIAAIIAAEQSHTLRAFSYATLATLVTGPEGLAGPPTCPLDGSAYQVVRADNGNAVTDGYAGAIDVRCPNRATHQVVFSPQAPVTNWLQSLPAYSTESLP